jgi:cyclopropane-fatty-acyl-phospholipid synthase
MCNARIAEAMAASGDLNLLDYEDMAPHYARTLKIWRENFDSKLAGVHALGFDDAFVRKWRYYLSYCEAAFGTRHITVAQMVYSRPDNTRLASPVYDTLRTENHPPG